MTDDFMARTADMGNILAKLYGGNNAAPLSPIAEAIDGSVPIVGDANYGMSSYNPYGEDHGAVSPGTMDTSHIPVAPLATGHPDVEDMKKLLLKLEGVSDTTVAKVTHDIDLDEAIATRKTAKGAKIGRWEIQMFSEGNRKFYDVVRADDGDVLARSLSLYEAAYGLVRILNNGGMINSRGAIELLHNERVYSGAVEEMIHYRHLLQKQKSDARRPVFEARYEEAKEKAITSKDRLIEMSRSYNLD